MKLHDLFEKDDQPSGEEILAQFKAGKITYIEAGNKLRDTGNSRWTWDLKNLHKQMRVANLRKAHADESS